MGVDDILEHASVQGNLLDVVLDCGEYFDGELGCSTGLW